MAQLWSSGSLPRIELRYLDGYRDAVSDDLTWLRTKPPAQIDGRLVRLRQWTDDDVADQLAAIRESVDSLVRWMPWAEGYSWDDSLEFLSSVRPAWDDRTGFAYAVIAADGRILGSVGLHPRIGAGALEIGYWIRSSARRQGIATRAAALVTAASFELDGVTHTEIRHDRANEWSGRIPRRLGYRHVATVARDRETASASGIALHWRMTADEFPASTAARLAADEAHGTRRATSAAARRRGRGPGG